MCLPARSCLHLDAQRWLSAQQAVMRQLEELSRAEVIAGSWRGSGIVVTADLNECFELANAYAPEHLCLLVKDPWS